MPLASAYAVTLAPPQPASVPWDTVLASANALAAAAAIGATPALLRGRKLALLCCSDADPACARFREAAMALGAHVAQIRPPLAGDASRSELRHAAQTLGRLYDAVECQGMSATLVQQIDLEAGVPVFDGIACDGHPSARLAERVSGAAAMADKRKFVVQAMLIAALS